MGGGLAKSHDRAVWVPVWGFFLTCLGCLRAGRDRGSVSFLLTCLGASLVYPLAAWQGYLGTSAGFLFDLFLCGVSF